MPQKRGRRTALLLPVLALVLSLISPPEQGRRSYLPLLALASHAAAQEELRSDSSAAQQHRQQPQHSAPAPDPHDGAAAGQHRQRPGATPPGGATTRSSSSSSSSTSGGAELEPQTGPLLALAAAFKHTFSRAQLAAFIADTKQFVRVFYVIVLGPPRHALFSSWTKFTWRLARYVNWTAHTVAAVRGRAQRLHVAILQAAVLPVVQRVPLLQSLLRSPQLLDLLMLYAYSAGLALGLMAVVRALRRFSKFVRDSLPPLTPPAMTATDGLHPHLPRAAVANAG